MKPIYRNVNQQIRSQLLGFGFTLADWSRRKGFKPATVQQTLWRYAGKSDGPKRGIALSIINQLEFETGIKICG